MQYPLPNHGFNSVYKTFHSVYLQQTSRCPNNCVFCAYIKGVRKQDPSACKTMPMEDLEHVLKSLPDFSGYVSLGMAGEGMLLADMPERIRLIKSYWPRCRCALTTTFNIWRDETFVASIFGNGLDNMSISCYAYTDADYETVHGSKQFQGLQKNILALGKLSPDQQAKVDIAYFSDLGKSLGIQEAEKKWAEFQKFAKENGIRRFIGHDRFSWNPPRHLDGRADWRLPSPCSVLWGAKAGVLNVHVNLDIVPCCMFTGEDFILGNLRESSLKEIFNSEKWHFFRDAWQNMQPQNIPVCNGCQVYVDFSRPEELARMAAYQAQTLQGKEAYFWGAGEAWRAYGSFFNSVRPVAMLLDQNAANITEIDGIPVRHPDSVLKDPRGVTLPLVIFASPKASAKIFQTLKERYPEYRPEKIVIVPANSALLPAGQ